MKKVFMSMAIVAAMLVAASCGNNAQKKAAEAAEPAATEECAGQCDSCKVECTDSTACPGDCQAAEAEQTQCEEKAAE